MIEFIKRLFSCGRKGRVDGQRAARRAKVAEAVEEQHEARIQLKEALAELSAARSARGRDDEVQ